MKKRAFLISVFLWISALPAFACAEGDYQWVKSVKQVMGLLQDGNYEGLREVLGENLEFDESGSLDELVQNLGEYAPNGFKICRELMRKDIPPLATKTIFKLVNSKDRGVYVYFFVLSGNVKFRSGIQIFRVNTDLDGILASWSHQ